MTNKLIDKNNKTLKVGQVVEIKGGYFKNSNGSFKIMNIYDGGGSCSMIRRNKNGQPSKAKHNLQFWPLISSISNRQKQIEANAHNDKNATIEIIKEDATETEEKLKETAINKAVKQLKEDQGQYIYTNHENILEELEFYGLEKTESMEIIKERYNNLESTKQRRKEELEQYRKEQEEIRKKEELDQKRQENFENNIIQNVEAEELEEQDQHILKSVKYAKLNKNNTLGEYLEEVKKGDYNKENTKITRKLHFKDLEALKNFNNMLLFDFNFLEGAGGRYEDENGQIITLGIAVYYKNKIQYIINTEGYSYSRYVGLIGDPAHLEQREKGEQATAEGTTEKESPAARATEGTTETKAKQELRQEEAREQEQKKAEKSHTAAHAAVEISFNEEKNGIEISFSSKPEKEVLENLKAQGFRWSRYQKIWYAKDTAERREFIKAFDADPEEKEKTIYEYPEIEINDSEDYKIDQELSRRENNGNWIFRSKERDHQKELKETLQHYQGEAVKLIQKTEDKKAIHTIKKALQRFKKAYYTNYMATLSNKASNPSWAVTGRSGRNMNKMNRAADRYNDLIGEGLEIVEEFENRLNIEARKIRTAARKKEAEEIKNTIVEIDFKVKQKELTHLNVTQSKRTYNYKNYMIVNSWGCFRIFKDGREIGDLKTTDTLSTAKKYVQYIINQEQRKQQQEESQAI